MKLVKISIKNFKGFAEASRKFKEKEIITAQNFQGKTTWKDAWEWLICLDVDKWEPAIQPSHIKIGTPENPCVTEICGEVEKDGLVYKLKRVSKQKWNVKQEFDDEGKPTENKIIEFKGNKNEYYFDSETDCGETRYIEQLSYLFECSYEDLKIITDVNYFSNDHKSWDKNTRRKYLFDKTGVNEKVDGFAYDEQYNLLKDDLLKIIQARKTGQKNIKTELDIKSDTTTLLNKTKKALTDNELLRKNAEDRLIPYKAKDYAVLNAKYAKLEAEYEKLLVASNKTNKSSIVAEMQSKLNELQEQLNNERDSIYRQERELSSKKFELESKNIRIQTDIQECRNDVLLRNHEIEKAQINIDEFQKLTFDDEGKKCECCGQDLPIEMLDKAIEKFEIYQKEGIFKNNLYIENKRKELLNIIGKENVLINQLQGVQSQLKALESEVIDKSKVDILEVEIPELSAKIGQLKMADVKNEVAEKIEAIKAELEELKEEKSQKPMRDIETEIENYKAKALELTKEQQHYFLKLNQIKLYTQNKIKLIDEAISSYFEDITFNFFKFNNAGASNEYEDVCEVIYKGINYNALSTAQKFRCNILVNKGLRKILNVNLPTFVDCLENVTKLIGVKEDEYWGIEGQYIGIKAVDEKLIDTKIVRISDVYSIQDCCVRSN